MARRPAQHPEGKPQVPGVDRTKTEVRSGSDRPDTPAGRLASGSGPGAEGSEPSLPVDDPNRYEMTGEIGRGGLGRVLEARDFRLGRTVAIKELLETSPAGEAMFVREALITARLQHPGVVPVHEAGRWPSGEPYYSMKRVSGSSLKELIRERSELADRLALLPHAIAVAEAIGYAHSESVIHRDLKPANVVVGEFGETVVVDWGLAGDLGTRTPAPTSAEGSATISGKVVGTPAYMPPEQARGEPLDERADVYALGALLYELLAGMPPYSGADADAILAQVEAGPPTALDTLEPAVPAELTAVVVKAMARNPSDRYRNGKELAEDLKRFQTGQLVTAHQYTTVGLIRRWLSRHRPVVAVAAVALVVLGVLGAVGLNRIISARSLAEERREIAEKAQAAAERRTAELQLLQARSSLDRDPTATLAWLKSYAPSEDELPAVRELVDQATALGVARHVLPHDGWVYTVAFVPGANAVVTGSQHGRVTLWNLDDGSSRVLGRRPVAIQAVAASADGKWVASGDRGGQVTLWPLDGGELRRFTDHRWSIQDLRFSPDGSRLIARSEAQRVIVRDLIEDRIINRGGDPDESREINLKTTASATDATGDLIAVAFRDRIELHRPGRPVERRPAPPEPVVRMTILPDGSLVTHDRTGALWHYGPDGAATRLGTHPGDVMSIEPSPDGRSVVTAGSDAVVRLWSLDGGDPKLLRGHTDSLYQALYTPDGEAVVTGSDDGTVRVFALAGGGTRVLRGHTDDVYRIATSDDGRWIASASLDNTVRIWALEHPATTGRLARGATVAEVHELADGKAVTLDRDGRVATWDPDSGAVDELGTTSTPSLDNLSKAATHFNSGHLAIGRADQGVDVYDVESGERISTPASEDRLLRLALSPAGDRLLVSRLDGSIRIRDLASGTETEIDRGKRPAGVTFTPGGDRVLYTLDNEVRLADPSGTTVFATLSLPGTSAGFAHAIDVSADGVWAAIALSGGDVIVWNLLDHESHVIDANRHQAIDLEFSPDSRLLALAVNDRTIRIHELETAVTRTVTGHTDLIFQVRWSPDGDRLASASYDHTARIWSPTGEALRILRGHGASVDCVDFSPDGSRLITGSRDGTVRVWPLERAAIGSPDALERMLGELTTAVIDDQGRPLTL